jgi:tRNA (guanine26-N2/guanine27-N2)-dimethyltransferase
MTAAKYDRAIVPLLSCSIDFYIRVFVKVIVSPQKRKLAARYIRLALIFFSKSSLLFYCHGCKSFATHPLGKVSDHEKGIKYGVNPLALESTCPVCEGRYQVGGPIYSGPLHDNTFVTDMLSYVKENQEKFGTQTRMIGMLSVISEVTLRILI